MYTVRVAGIAASLVLAACGSSATSVLPAPADDVPAPFDAGSAADDDTPGVVLSTEADGGTSEATTGDASSDAGVSATPLVAPAGQWTWVDFPNTQCANGTPTGIGVNLAPGSRDVLIFLQGGGACWDAATCWGPVSTSFFVATGYGATEFSLDVLRTAMLPMRREDPLNPFRGMNLVYVPYCTGDVHAGDRVAHYSYGGVDHPTWHVGYRNLGIFLQRIVATFPDAQRVILAGDSAGGFGSALNMDRVQQVFPHARVDVLDDSGQPIRPDPPRWSQWRAAWNLQLPADCPHCGDDVGASVTYLRAKYPDNRFGLISYSHDSVITTFMGLDPGTFSTELQSFGDEVDRTWAHGRYYYIPGILHVGLAAPGPGLLVWLNAFASDDPGWSSFRIPGL